MTNDITELRAAYARLREFIERCHSTNERRQQAHDDLKLLGEAVRDVLNEDAPEQMTLVSVPTKGGY